MATIQNTSNACPPKGIPGLPNESSVDILNRPRMTVNTIVEYMNRHFLTSQGSCLEGILSLDTLMKLMVEEVELVMKARNATSLDARISGIKEVNRLWIRSRDKLNPRAQRHWRADWFLMYCYYIAYPELKITKVWSFGLNDSLLSRQVHCLRLKKEGRWVDRTPKKDETESMPVL